LQLAHGAKNSKHVEYKQLAKWFLKIVILLATLWSKIFNLSNFDMIYYFIDPPNEHVLA
jgi:polyferredoxin